MLEKEKTTVDQTADQEKKTEPKLKRKKKWPLVAAVLLLLVCGSTYYAYTNGYLEAYLKPSENTNTDNTDKENNDTKNTEKPKDTNKTNSTKKTENNSSSTSDDKKTETNTNSGNNNSNNSGTSNNKPSTNNSGSGNNSGNSGSSGNNTGCTWVDKKVLVSEGHYEQRLVKAAWSEWIETKAAWTEEDTYCYAWGQDRVEVQICNQCGAVFYSRGEANAHIGDGSSSCGGYHNDYIDVGEPHCKEWKTEYINHPAEGYYQNHPAEYESVWVDAVYKTERVCE